MLLSALIDLLYLSWQGAVLCDIILLNFLKGAEQYKAKKFEEVLLFMAQQHVCPKIIRTLSQIFLLALSVQVSEAQIEASIAQSPGSQLSLKCMKSSCDSGALSLNTYDQPL